MSRIYVALDLETTGFSAERDAILEIGAVKFRVPVQPGDDPVLDRWSTLVNPGRSIPYRITRLTGITDSDVEQAPRLATVLDDVRAFVGNYPVIGHNVAFELSFLRRHGLLVGQAHLDTFELASILLPDAPRYSLGELAAYLALDFDGWHRALADAEMAARLFLKLWQEACALPTSVLENIATVSMDSSWPLRSFFVAAHRSQAQPTPAAPPPSRAFPPIPTGKLEAVDHSAQLAVEDVRTLLGATGPIARAMPHFEERAEQVAMLDTVLRAFDSKSHLIVEAGTGSGKSLAYLVASVYQATTQGERVVISTNTLNLQDQLYNKELPFLAASLDHPFTALRLKGRTNYVCARRVEMLRRRGSFSEAEARLLARVLVWLERTRTGDRAELHIQPDEEPVWEMICADYDSCRLDRCAPYGPCYWLETRARADGAHILVVNHALLLADLASGGGLIPPYNYLIVDEAHHLEEQATQQFGFVMSKGHIDRVLARLGDERQGRQVGVLAAIRQRVREGGLHGLQSVVEQCGLLLRQVEQSRESTSLLFEAIDDVVREQPRQESHYRILPEWRNQYGWIQLVHAVETLATDLRLVAEGLAKLGEQLQPYAGSDPLWQEQVDECRRASVALTTVADEVSRILIHPDRDDINWITVREGDEEEELPDITLFRAPMQVAPLLQERLFHEKQSVVLTSATLSSEGSFAFLRDRLGVDEANELSLGSPYNFRKQALVYVASDLPEPNQPGYAATLHRAILELARATEGRMLVLFTSKSQLNAAYRAISDPLAQDDIVVLGQYMDGSRTQLVERFRTTERAVLLGTHSFWEGIDIPGPALSCLVITRLPFPVPTDPVQSARSQAYGNPFQEYALPQTVIRFRQGFGRLLRTTQDRGIVALLDSRLSNRAYGQTFLHSLPPVDLREGPFRNLPPLAARWLNEEALRPERTDDRERMTG